MSICSDSANGFVYGLCKPGIEKGHFPLGQLAELLAARIKVSRNSQEERPRQAKNCNLSLRLQKLSLSLWNFNLGLQNLSLRFHFFFHLVCIYIMTKRRFTMKRIAKLGYCVLLVLLFAACKQSQEFEEDVSPAEELTLRSEQDPVVQSGGGDVFIRFYASSAWTVSVPEEVSGWCLPAQTAGEAGEVELLVILASNDQTEDRNARITVACGTEVFSVFIVQKQRNALTVSTNRFELEPAGGIIAVEVKSNIDYDWEMEYGMDKWVMQVDEAEAAQSGVLTRYAPTRALTSETLYFRILPNTGIDVRSGNIVFYSSSQTDADGLPLEEVVSLYQRERDVVMLTEPVASVGDDGGWLEVEINSNVDFEVQMPGVDWIQQNSATRAISSHTLYFQVLANDTYDVREADLVFRQKGNPALADTLHVVQAEKEGLVLGADVIEASQDGEIVEVRVKANVETELYILDQYADWLKQVDTQLKTRALTEHCYYLEVAPNPSYDERVGYVLVRGTGDEYHQQELKIVQGQQRYLAFEKDTLVVEPEGDDVYLYLKTSVDYAVELTADWLQTASTRSLARSGVSVTVKPYTDVNQPLREGMVIIKDTKSELADTAFIMQKPLLHGEYVVDPAGSLPDLIPEDWKLEMRVLKLSGKLNGTDIHFIREMAGYTDNDKATGGRLDALDLGDTEIVGGGDAYYSRWGSGAMIPTPISYWYTADSGSWEEMPGGSRTLYYSEGIGARMFRFSRLTSLVLPQRFSLIGEEAFSSCHVTHLTLPETVTSIGKKAFYGSKLKTLHVKALTPPQLGESALRVEEGTLTVYVPSQSVEVYKAADGWKDVIILSDD